MAKIVVLGVSGEDTLYVADLDAGTVAPLPASGAGPLQAAVDLGKAGAAVIKGVDVAICVDSGADIFSGRFD
ncbi:MAG TPA: hypothetical protein VD840_18480 [Sinorhizobium sp.]|nr:hypothetical protein [Sinorhizobium sp.]